MTAKKKSRAQRRTVSAPSRSSPDDLNFSDELIGIKPQFTDRKPKRRFQRHPDDGESYRQSLHTNPHICFLD